MLSKPFTFSKVLPLMTFSTNNSPFELNELQSSLMGQLPVFPSTPQQKSTKERESFTSKNTKEFKITPTSWQKDANYLTPSEALKEAARCLKCADAPCQKGCSANVDIRQFIYNIEKGNWYGAAKTILSDNPLGLSCAQLCPVGELCAGNCNLKDTELGSVKINRLQEIAMKVFKEMGIKQELDPKIIKNLPESYNEKIALIGGGPASLTCATFLARLGYKNVHIYEKEEVAGGIPQREIPENRVPVDGTQWEIDLVKQIGVKIFTGKKFGKDITEESLKKDGYKTIFLGIGFPQSNQEIGSDKLKKIYNSSNVYTAKKFLKDITEQTKFNKPQSLKLNGHIVIMGIGDTAIDCARSALRAGANRVSLVFRRGWDDMRAYHEEIELAIKDKCNFVPYCILKDFEVDQQGKLKKLKFINNFPKNDKYERVNESNIEMQCDGLITAFGAQLGNEQWIQKYAKDGIVNINQETGQHKQLQDIFAGGDAIGSTKLVDAVNDGKNAAYHMHKYIQSKHGINVGDFKLPGFYTEIDSVDISMTFGNKKFENPFGLASAPPCTSYPMIKRAFEQGWGFAVVKTFTLDKDAVVNVSPRIYKATADEMKREAAFANIELISEKSAEYWIKGAQNIKKQFPNKVLVGSLMQGNIEEDWITITKMANEAGFDLLELNLSCPHGMTEKGMGRACGEKPELVKTICSWVKKVANAPFFVKITPNYPYSEEIAKAALAGGAFGVTLTNTMPSLMDPLPDGIPWPAVSDQKKTAYGGSCGSVLRPYSLKKASETAKAVPGIPIFGSGGIISCSNAMAYMRYGATALQVCSAVQNQDFATVIYDLITGVKAHLYLGQIENLKKQGWIGFFNNQFQQQFLRQQPPNNIGKLQNKGENRAKNVQQIKDIIGSNLHHISQISDMVNDTFVIPEFDQDKCLKCGRCYLTCADSGYQAIKLKGENDFPEVTDDCTGCGLCYAVCPVPGALTLINRKTPYTPCRGIPLGPDGPKDVTVQPKK